MRRFYACLVGKGITFDSGGYSIKQSAFYGLNEIRYGRRGDSNRRAGVRHYPVG